MSDILPDYLAKINAETAEFLDSLEEPLAKLTTPQEGSAFDVIADSIESSAPNPDAVYEGLRKFGIRNRELHRATQERS